MIHRLYADACDLYVLKPIHFENHMYCDALTLCVIYVMKIFRYDQDHPDNLYLAGFRIRIWIRMYPH
jgi:hypothetical protein